MTEEMQPRKPQAEMDALREKMDTLSERVKTDPSFRDDLKKDPEGALMAAGIDEGAAREAAAQWQSRDAEVEGHLQWCVDWTLWWICDFFTI